MARRGKNKTRYSAKGKRSAEGEQPIQNVDKGKKKRLARSKRRRAGNWCFERIPENVIWKIMKMLSSVDVAYFANVSTYIRRVANDRTRDGFNRSIILPRHHVTSMSRLFQIPDYHYRNDVRKLVIAFGTVEMYKRLHPRTIVFPDILPALKHRNFPMADHLASFIKHKPFEHVFMEILSYESIEALDWLVQYCRWFTHPSGNWYFGHPDIPWYDALTKTSILSKAVKTTSVSVFSWLLKNLDISLGVWIFREIVIKSDNLEKYLLFKPLVIENNGRTRVENDLGLISEFGSAKILKYALPILGVDVFVERGILWKTLDLFTMDDDVEGLKLLGEVVCKDQYDSITLAAQCGAFNTFVYLLVRCRLYILTDYVRGSRIFYIQDWRYKNMLDARIDELEDEKEETKRKIRQNLNLD